MRWPCCLALVVVGCVDMDDKGPAIEGTSGDVTTAPGDYVGYRVVSPCEGTWVNIGVTGTGTRVLSTTEEISAAGAELGASVRDFGSVWGHGGVGLSCEPGVGTSVHTSSWYDVDALIVRIGDYLRDRDLALQVGISVGSIPVPHAN